MSSVLRIKPAIANFTKTDFDEKYPCPDTDYSRSYFISWLATARRCGDQYMESHIGCHCPFADQCYRASHSCAAHLSGNPYYAGFISAGDQRADGIARDQVRKRVYRRWFLVGYSFQYSIICHFIFPAGQVIEKFRLMPGNGYAEF